MFNFKLYKEGLRKSLFLAILFIAIMKLGAVLIPIAQITSHISALNRGWSMGRTVVDGLGGGNFALILAMIAFAPFVTLYLFSFLNKRNSSDFYHSLPHKRETIFISYLAAILTWVIGAIWLSTFITLGIYAMFPQFVMVNLSNILLISLGLSAGCLLVIAAVLMAMSVTGGAFANIVTALLILFLPRTIMAAFTALVAAGARVLPTDSFGIFGDHTFNIPFSTPFYLFDSWGMRHMFIRGALYTAVLGLIYMGIALLLFKRRKSETAGNPAQGGLLQNMIRIAVAFVVCLPAIVLILEWQRGWGGSGQFIGILALYAIAVVAYFAYELITTRKFSNIVKALPGLGILVLLNIVFISGVTITQNVILNRSFEVDQIAAVQIEGLDQRWSHNVRSHEEIRSQDISIEDDRLTEILLYALARQIRHERGERYVFDFRELQHRIGVTLERHSGGSVRRTFLVIDHELTEILGILSQDVGYRDAFMNLPEHPSDIWSPWLAPDEALTEIYAILREEVRGLDFVVWSRSVNAHVWNLDPASLYGTINVMGFIGQETFQSQYPISTLTPRALERYLAHVNTENFERIEAGLRDALETDARSIWFSIQGRGEMSPISIHPWDWSAPSERALLEVVLDAIQTQGTTPVDLSRPHFSIDFSGRYFGGNFFFNSDAEELVGELDAILAMMAERDDMMVTQRILFG